MRRILSLIAWLMASLWFAACSDDDPQGLQPDETPMLVVVYPIDGLGDRFDLVLPLCGGSAQGLFRYNREMTYRELYTYLVSHTLGSHVKIFNAPQFGNLYRESPKEFFVAGQ